MARGWRRDGELLFNGCRVTVWSYSDTVLETVTMVIQCKCTQCHWTAPLKMAKWQILLYVYYYNKKITRCPHTFLRPSSSSSVRGHGWSFSSGLTKGEACLVSGLRLGDRITLAGTAPPCELMDSSERWGLPVREPVWGWEVLKRKEKKKGNSSGTWFLLTSFTFSSL